MASSYEYDFDLEDLSDWESEKVAASFHLFDDFSDDEHEQMCQSQSNIVSEHQTDSVPLQRSTSSSFSYVDESNGEQQDVSRASRRETVAQHQTENVSRSRAQTNPLNLSKIIWSDKSLIEQARSRHRRRRYDLFSNLLLSASDSLLLDKSQGKAFIPILRSLLTPPKKSAEEMKQKPRMPAKWLRRATTVALPTSSSHDDSGYKSDPGVIEPSYSVGESAPTTTSDFDDDDRYFMLRDLGDSGALRAFLETLSPGAGFRCLSLVLLQHLLSSDQGYDARVRHVFKKLGVIVLVHEMEREQYSFGPDGEKMQLLTNAELAELATRKFEALEHGIAAKLIRLSEIQRRRQGRNPRRADTEAPKGSMRELRRGISREQLMRGLKVGSAGLVAGTLFAVTGGLAAPGIAAGIAAIAGSAAATAAVVTLTSTAAVTAIFGVGGGSLAAYKMQRRTQGLTEFSFQKESQPGRMKGREGKGRIEPELFSTICISGWLRDNCDFQRPWGVSPTNPRITDRLELLERFYSVHRPDHVPKCGRILSKWKNEERNLWNLLKNKYGRDPDHLFPIGDGPRQRGLLTLEQDEILDQLFVALGHIPAEAFLDDEVRSVWKSTYSRHRSNVDNEGSQHHGGTGRNFASMSLEESLHGSRMSFSEDNVDGDSSMLSESENAVASSNSLKEQKEKELPKHLMTVWDYQATYGGELYTVKWESALLVELCDSVADMAIEVLEQTTRHLLKATALGTLMTAVAAPAVLLSALNVIDGSWTLAIERSDEAGKELAKSLLFSRAGHRPVTLVGFSMGARVIYSCLKELARYQEKWEDARERRLKRSSRMSNKNAPLDGGNNFAADDNIKVFDGMREPASIVEDAILMGLPNHLNLTSWVACRQVVGGRLINCYSRKDLILSLMFQSKKITRGLKRVCGTCAVEVPGVENFDVTDLVGGHQDYCLATGNILKRVRHGMPIRRKQGSEPQTSNEDAAAATIQTL